ncbi:MAG: ribosome silencing factor [Betaproteobacteria bacterium]|nr:MAG: ribosome silencing factor [Betaproteobacteria bacterium]
MGPEKLAKIAIAALEDIKARDIVVFNVKKMTALFDKVIIASGDSNRQVRALANNVCEEVKKSGGRVYSTEGEQTGEWVLVDLGAVIVHVMQPAIRQYYNLEEIWGTPQRPAARKTVVRRTVAAKKTQRRSAR